MKKYFLVLICIFLCAGGAYVIIFSGKKGPENTDGIVSSVSPRVGVAYVSESYGFSFNLPESWRGYSVVTTTWQGYMNSNEEGVGQVLVQEGPEISIRHPLWTEQHPRQDIPIMIFTVAQWDSLQKDAFHIGAAPIGPSKLGENSAYVFALPARYNFAYPDGVEEVEDILRGNPLRTFN